MQTVNTRFEIILTKTMDEETENARDRICAGVMTHDEYLRECGKIAGFQMVKGWFEEINKELAESTR